MQVNISGIGIEDLSLFSIPEKDCAATSPPPVYAGDSVIPKLAKKLYVEALHVSHVPIGCNKCTATRTDDDVVNDNQAVTEIHLVDIQAHGFDAEDGNFIQRRVFIYIYFKAINREGT